MRVTLRRRLTIAFALVATGVLVVACVGTWFAVRGSAQRIARDDLREQATRIQALTGDLRTDFDAANAARPDRRNAQLLRQFIEIARGAQVSDARLVWIAPDGHIVQAEEAVRIFGQISRSEPELLDVISLPDGLTEADLDGKALREKAAIEGSIGALVYRAEVLTDAATNHTLAVVLTGIVDTEPQRTVIRAFAMASLVALAISIGVSTWLARRIASRVGAVGDAAARIADGDLTARVEIDPGGEAELAALGATINRMAVDLERARASERAFLMSVSHDLRTPLTSIRGYAEALADGTLDDGDAESRHRAATVISAEARRLERLVQDLLDLGRFERREFSLHPRPCDAGAIVRDTAAGFVPHAAQLGLRLVVPSGSSIPADLDPERLAQIVANLVENALKFARAEVAVSIERRDDRVVVIVDDDGPGVDAAHAEAVFARLHTVRGVPGRSVGTGLGLAIVRELATAMGGDASVETRDGGGSRFVVTVAAG